VTVKGPFPDRLFRVNTGQDIQSGDAELPEVLRISFARSLPGSSKEASAADPLDSAYGTSDAMNVMSVLV